MSQYKLRICVVGVGRMGQIRVPLLNRHPRVSLKYIVDIDKKKGKSFAQKYNAKYASDFKDVDFSTIDAVWVATGTFLHEEIIRKAAEETLAVFCEKPISEDPKKIETLFKICHSKGVPLCCGFQRRFDRSYIAARNAVVSGKIGKPTMVRVMMGDHPLPPIAFLMKGGDPFLDLAPHDIDYLRWVLQDDPVEIYATGSSSIPKLQKAGVLDVASITMKFKKGTLVTMLMTRGATYGYDQRCEFFGTKGMVAVENELDNACVLADTNGFQSSVLKYSFPQRFKKAFEAEVDGFVCTVLDGKAWPITCADCVTVQNIANTASRSQEEGKQLPFDALVSKKFFCIRPVGKGNFGSYIISLMKNHEDHEVKYNIMPPHSPSTKEVTWEEGVLKCKKVDAVYICSPDKYHQPQAIECLYAGKHVLVEKPVKPSYDDVQCALDKAQKKLKKSLVLMIGFMRRFDKSFICAKKLISANQNNVKHIIIESRDPVPAEADLMFVLYNSVCHDIDMINWLFPQDSSIIFTEIQTNVTCSGIDLYGKLEKKDNSSVKLTIKYSKVCKTYIQRLHVILQDGHSHMFGHEFFPDVQGHDQVCSVYEQAYHDQWSHFINLCTNGEPVTVKKERLGSYSRTFSILKQVASQMKQLCNPAKKQKVVHHPV